MACNILFTCAGRRNYLLKYFKDAINGNGKIFAVDSHKYAAASADADLFLEVPKIYSKHYIPKLEEIIHTYKITALISLNDLELVILSKHKARLEQLGVKLLVSSKEVIDTAYDKWNTHQFITKIGLNSPKTFKDFNIALAEIEKGTLKFPVVLKPRFGSASIGVEVCNDIEELKLVYTLQTKRIKNSKLCIDKFTSLDELILIQEKLEGKEYGYDVVNDFDGNFFTSLLREKLAMRNGETAKAKSVINTDFDKLAKTLGENLNHIGNLDGDAFLIDNQWYFIDLNPRFGGGYPFSHEAGANVAAIYVDWLLGKTENLASHIKYIPGLVFSKCDRLVEINKKSYSI